MRLISSLAKEGTTSPTPGNHSITSSSSKAKRPEREIGETGDDPIEFRCPTSNSATEKSTSHSVNKRTKSTELLDFSRVGCAELAMSCRGDYEDETVNEPESPRPLMPRESTPPPENPDIGTQPADLTCEFQDDGRTSGYETGDEGNEEKIRKKNVLVDEEKEGNGE
ncbi:hypothetical protein GQX73_g9629 [Xylaria multiplex]|uniref:Uncharacterized protein n=1 Tax=Xylaria multiplex TaxID=323545 RepID=A0A7C8IU82_9PEZI|nr:hypothetical protein GQX73_g9629 [Xylaria multiplex]